MRILTGDVDSFARSFHWPQSDDPEYWTAAQQRQEWLHSLEHLELVAGVELSALPNVLRDEFVDSSGARRSPTTSIRLLKLWRESRPFLFLWINHGLLNRNNDPSDLVSYDEHVASLLSVMTYAYGQSENWGEAANQRWETELAYIKSKLRLSPGAMISEWQA